MIEKIFEKTITEIISECDINESEKNKEVLQTILGFFIDECNVSIEEIKSGSILRDSFNYSSADGILLIHEIDTNYDYDIPDKVVYNLNISLKEFVIMIMSYVR